MKRDDKALLKQKYYSVHKEEDILFSDMKAVYNILNNPDKVKMKHFYHIRCDHDLDYCLCAMWSIPFDCTRFVEKLSNSWLPNLDKTLQPFYVIEPETRKCFSILRGYNKWYISTLTFKKETTKPEEMEIKYELVLKGITWAEVDGI